MKPIVKGLAVAAGILILTSFSAFGVAAQGPRDTETSQVFEGTTDDRQSSEGKPGEPFAKVELANGDTISFFEIKSSDGSSAIAVAGEEQPGHQSIIERPEMARANALEIFNAVSRPGTEIPKQLRDRYGDAKLGSQGWLKPANDPAAAATNWCNTNSFQNNIPNWDGRLVRLNERPVNHPERWSNFPAPNGTFFTAQAYKYEATVYNVDDFYTRVAVCDLDDGLQMCSNPFFCINYGPVIEFRYRDHNNQPGSWGYAFIGAGYNVGYSAWWMFDTGQNWDWRTRILAAEANEKFNIGLAWNN